MDQKSEKPAMIAGNSMFLLSEYELLASNAPGAREMAAVGGDPPVIRLPWWVEPSLGPPSWKAAAGTKQRWKEVQSFGRK